MARTPQQITEDRMQAHVDVEHSLITRSDDADSVDAEFVEETSSIRRAPSAGEMTGGSGGRISMELADWLEVDHTLHELYNLVEIAILQRDEAIAAREAAESKREVAGCRLIEWKTYARKLERRLQESQMENLALMHRASRAADLADEALELGPFARRRRKELRRKLEAVSSEE